MPAVSPELVDRLAQHRLLAKAPREQLEWLAAHGEIAHLKTGDVLTPKTGPVLGLYIVLSGHLSTSVDRGNGPHKVFEWRDGDVTGVLPYSRIVAPPGDVIAEAPTEILTVGRQHLAQLVRDCEELTSIFVHVMLDRARAFTTSDLHDEKMLSLGRLAAGLAHELNNPASAVARSAEALAARLDDVEAASRGVGALALSPAQREAVDKARTICRTVTHASALARADREEEITEWMDEHGIRLPTEPLVDSSATPAALDELAAVLDATQLPVVIRWLVADCAQKQLIAEIQAAATRVHNLVAAVKGFTYMDQATMPKSVDLTKSLGDTIAVLGSKARMKSLPLSLDVAPDVPPVLALGGALNQVWANLIDNALDAARTRVDVAAVRRGDTVVVTVTDDGAGVPPDLRSRIFDPFFTTKPLGQGVGIGLDAARRIVQQHRGAIELDSRDGRTVFAVTLPVDPGKL
jgi:signal transduction histidine kinase